MTDTDQDQFFAVLDSMTPTKPVDPDAAREAAECWAAAARSDAMADEAERRGHENMSLKFAYNASHLRMEARFAEAAARGIELE